MVIAVQLSFLTFVISGMTVRAVAGPVFAAPDIVFGAPVDIVGDHKIEKAVPVIVERTRACRPLAFVTDPCFCRYIGKRSVTVVVIENRAAVSGDVTSG